MLLSRIQQRKLQTPKFRWLWLVFAGVSVGLLCLLGGGVAYIKSRHLQVLGVQSSSMEPALSKGDLVTVQPAAHSQLAVGDIVTFLQNPGSRYTLTHRVVAVDPNSKTITTKGDANQAPDQPFPANRVVGKVAHSVPYAGSLIDFIRHPVGLVFVIYLPALMVAAAELKRLAAHYRSRVPYRLRSWALKTHPKHDIRPVVTGFIALSVCALLGLPLQARAALSSQATLGATSIQSISVPARYNVCQFPSNESLLSYAPEDALFPEQTAPPLLLDMPIVPGTYKVTATSFDSHTSRPNSPTQPNERWFAQLYSKGDHLPALITGATDDIPNHSDSTETIVNNALTVTKTLTGIRYSHNALITGLEIDNFGGRRFDNLSESEKRQVVWNSVHPVCLNFERLPVRASRQE